MAELDLDRLDIDHTCRHMSIASFIESLCRMPYPVLVYLHSELTTRIGEIDFYLEENRHNVEWVGRARSARKKLMVKANAVASRVNSARELSLARLASRHGGVAGVQDSPVMQVRFLVGLIDRLLDHDLLDPDERVVLDTCRLTAMGPVANGRGG